MTQIDSKHVRRLHQYVLNGGKLTANEVSAMAQAMEEKETENENLRQILQKSGIEPEVMTPWGSMVKNPALLTDRKHTALKLSVCGLQLLNLGGNLHTLLLTRNVLNV